MDPPLIEVFYTYVDITFYNSDNGIRDATDVNHLFQSGSFFDYSHHDIAIMTML